MSKLFQRNAFNLGFWVGILVFIGLNFYSLNANYGGCIDCYGKFGIPFPLMDSGLLLQRILWIGLIADILIALIFSFAVGLIFKFVWEKLMMKKLR